MPLVIIMTDAIVMAMTSDTTAIATAFVTASFALDS